MIGQLIGSPYGDIANLEVACGAEFRGATAGCEAATCSPGNYTTTQLLAQQLCGSFYSRNATLSSAVSSAVASATSAAKAATEGKDPTDLANFPPCGVSRELSVHHPAVPKSMYQFVGNWPIPAFSKYASHRIITTAAGATRISSASAKASHSTRQSTTASCQDAARLMYRVRFDPLSFKFNPQLDCEYWFCFPQLSSTWRKSCVSLSVAY